MRYTTEERAAYSQKIRAYEQSDTWRRRAHAFIACHGDYCDSCGSITPGQRTDVHHITYTNAFTGREPDEDLRALCRTDHEAVHAIARAGTMNLHDATTTIIETGQTKRRHPTNQPSPYSYDPRTWDTYARNNPSLTGYTRYQPARRRTRKPRDNRQRTFGRLLAILIWTILIGAILIKTAQGLGLL